jgi:DNA helicase-2/ATP-dependent DNA helicase PcrA
MVRLNKEQQEAVKFGQGPLLIIAGAGTGKTTVITERIKYLILSKKAKPSEILALTFTEKAAREMEERVDVGLPYGYTEMWIMTFHSFCDRILKREALHIGIDPRFKLMTEAGSIQLLRNNLYKFNLNYFRPLGNPNKFVKGIIQHFSRLQDEDISPSDYLAWAKEFEKISKKGNDEQKIEAEKWSELSDVYRAYDEIKLKQGFMDFGDLIVKTLKVFRDRPNILAEYRKRFKYILVDEYQDTNFAQNELVKLLTGKNGNITVVADDDQSIYRFRGAAVSNVIQFRKSFPKTDIKVLAKNYRSTQEILDRSYDLIQFNNPDRLEVVEKINKKLVSQISKEGIGVSFIHADRVENEADEIAKEIKILTTEENYKFKDFAVLLRANNHGEPIIRALGRHGIPFQFLGPGRLFKQPEIVDLIAFFKVLINYEDSTSFFRILSHDHFGLSGYDIARLGVYSRKYNVSLFEAAEKSSEIFEEKDTADRIQNILGIIKKYLNLVKKDTAGQILYYFLEDTGMLKNLLSPDGPASEKVAKNIAKFFDKLKSYEVDHEDSSVFAVSEWLDISLELGESPLATDIDWTEVDAVNLLTAHSAKGLEFPVVFLVNLVSQRFPTNERSEQIPIPEKLVKEILPMGDYHVQEERRLFYVGMTRAKERLYFTAANYYGESKREKKLSPFIFEALGDKAIGSEQVLKKSQQLTLLDFKPSPESEVVTTTAFHVDYLSYSQIETFTTCPLHYKMKYIYKLPTPQSASQSFGSAIHKTFQVFYDTLAKGDKPSNSLILDIYKDNWIKEGFKDKVQEKEFYQKGKDYLSGFLKTVFDKNKLPVAQEVPFNITLTREGERSIKIGGKIDKVEVDGEGNLIITDYKTGGNLPSKRDVDKNLQLSFYALAAENIQEKPFGVAPENIRLNLYYLDQQEIFSTERSRAQLNKAVDDIFRVRREIEESDFKCSGHMFCLMGCEFSMFCKTDDNE